MWPLRGTVRQTTYIVMQTVNLLALGQCTVYIRIYIEGWWNGMETIVILSHSCATSIAGTGIRGEINLPGLN